MCSPSRLDKDALKYFVFASTRMGWINCDRFWEIEEEAKTNFVVRTTGAEDSKVQIVFNDINSIMNGTRDGEHMVFYNVPKGRSIKVVGIQYANGSPTMATAETTIDDAGFELTAFHAFTLGELEQALNRQ